MGRPNAELLKSAAVAALGSFLFGFDTAVISGTTDALRLRFGLSEGQLGFTVASALLGTILGSLGSGAPAEKHGRRPVLQVLAVLYFVSALGCAFAWDWWSLVFFRFVGGLAIGGSSVVAPLFIAEISPPAIRGRLVGPEPVQRGGGHPGRLPLELLHRGRAGGAGVRGLAGHARRSRGPRRALLPLPARHPGEPALAGEAAPRATRPPPSWVAWATRSREKLVARDRGVAPRGDGGRRRAVLPAEVPAAHPPRPHGRHLQPALGHQRPHLLHRRHLRAWRGRGARARSCSP